VLLVLVVLLVLFLPVPLQAMDVILLPEILLLLVVALKFQSFVEKLMILVTFTDVTMLLELVSQLLNALETRLINVVKHFAMALNVLQKLYLALTEMLALLDPVTLPMELVFKPLSIVMMVMVALKIFVILFKDVFTPQLSVTILTLSVL
jgi:hypothetical protein